MVKKVIGCSFLTLALLGCGNDKESNNKYSGIWHEAGNQESIIKIMNNGDVIRYECSLSGSYSQITDDTSMKVVGNNLIITSNGQTFTFSLDIKNDILTTTSETDGPESLERLNSIPDTCNGNAMKIVYISSTDIYEGQDTSFTIDLNYRLLEPSATMNVFFSGENDVYFSPDEPSIDITQAANGSSSITVNHEPIDLEGASPYYLNVLMQPSDSDSTAIFDRKLLTIHSN